MNNVLEYGYNRRRKNSHDWFKDRVWSVQVKHWVVVEKSDIDAEKRHVREAITKTLPTEY